MVIPTDDLERLADDTFTDRRITSETFCGKCGYNLRTLPYIYACPECGNEYNARALKMRGIFMLYETEIPWSDLFTSLLCVASTAWLVYAAVKQQDVIRIGFALLFVAFTFIFGRQAYAKTARWWKAQVIIRRIQAQQRDWNEL